MRSHVVLALAMLLLLVGSVYPLYAQDTEADVEVDTAPQFFTLSAGWSWPSGGPVQDTYESGFTAAGSFRTGMSPNYLAGIEVGYTWYTLDAANLASLNPGTTFSGGDFGLLSITTENDYLFGTSASAFRPFLNLGLGYFKSFIDDTVATTGGTTSTFSTGVYEGSFFGFHGAIGGLINRDRFGIRLDADYVHLFAGGPDLEFFSARAGLIFYMSS